MKLPLLGLSEILSELAPRPDYRTILEPLLFLLASNNRVLHATSCVIQHGVAIFPGISKTFHPTNIATAKAVKTLNVRHLQWHLVNNQTDPVFYGFDFLSKTSIAQFC